LGENAWRSIRPIPLQSFTRGHPKGSGLGIATDIAGIRTAPTAYGDPGAAEYYDVNSRYQDALKKMYSDRNAYRNYGSAEAKADLERDKQDVAELRKQLSKARSDWNKTKVHKYIGTSGVPQL
jgi:hypothetical protein